MAERNFRNIFTFFYLLSFYLYIRSKENNFLFNWFYLLSVASFFIATFCKEPSLTLPIILIAYDYVFTKERASVFVNLKRYVCYLIVALVYFIIRFYALGGFAPSKSHHELNTYKFLINISPLFIHYIEKLVMPVNLNVLYEFYPVVSVFDPKGIIAILITFVFLLLTFLSLKKKTVFFGLFIMVIPLLLALYIPALGEGVFAERYLYLPSFGFVILIALFLERINVNIPKETIILPVLFIALIGLYSAGTISRNAVWKDSYTLWKDTVKKSPDSAPAHEYLGYALYTKGQIGGAIKEYNVALKIDSHRVDSHINMGVAYAVEGLADKAIEQYEIALEMRPGFTEARNNLGLAFMNKGFVDKAIEEYKIALEQNPNFAEVHNNLGIAYGVKGLIDSAVKEFQTAVELNPGNENYNNNLLKVYEMKGLYKENE